MKALLDASVLIPDGKRQRLETYARLGYFEGFWSPWIVEEMARHVTWRWAKRYGLGSDSRKSLSGLAKLAMGHLEATFRVISPTTPSPPAWPSLGDPGDHPIWAAAMAASVDYVVSDNTRDFPPPDPQGTTSHLGITYITCDTFIKGIEDGTI